MISNIYRLGRLERILTAVGLIAYARHVRAMDKFEIQVYEDDLNRPGQVGLETHLNYTIEGHRAPAYQGELPPNHVTRITFEPALGITEFMELGAYLQNMFTGDGRYRFSGIKLRSKFVLPTRYTGDFFFGINVELGRVPRAVEEQGWANEFRPIAGFYDGHWLFDINPIVGYALSGPDKFKPDFEPAGKIGFNTQKGFMLGAEYYAGLGLLTAPSPLGEQEHLLFLTFDLAEAAQDSAAEHPWELNVGIGRSLTEATPQRWIAKAIVGYSF
jgi:hypothetical protein